MEEKDKNNNNDKAKHLNLCRFKKNQTTKNAEYSPYMLYSMIQHSFAIIINLNVIINIMKQK